MTLSEQLAIPSAYRDAVISDHALAAIGAWRRRHQSALCQAVLVGPTGVGKTWDAAAMASTYQGGDRCYWIDAARINEIHSDDWPQVIETRRLVVLDDFGSRITQGAVTRSYELIDGRSKAMLPVVVTGNLSREHPIDERIRSRLLAYCVVDYRGLPDRRAQQ